MSAIKSKKKTEPAQKVKWIISVYPKNADELIKEIVLANVNAMTLESVLSITPDWGVKGLNSDQLYHLRGWMKSSEAHQLDTKKFEYFLDGEVIDGESNEK